jgi:hypothetical protein
VCCELQAILPTASETLHAQKIRLLSPSNDNFNIQASTKYRSTKIPKEKITTSTSTSEESNPHLMVVQIPCHTALPTFWVQINFQCCGPRAQAI